MRLNVISLMQMYNSRTISRKTTHAVQSVLSTPGSSWRRLFALLHWRLRSELTCTNCTTVYIRHYHLQIQASLTPCLTHHMTVSTHIHTHTHTHTETQRDTCTHYTDHCLAMMTTNISVNAYPHTHPQPLYTLSLKNTVTKGKKW